MPLFGHKNKNHQNDNDAGLNNDTSADLPNSHRTGGHRDNVMAPTTGGPGNTQANDPNYPPTTTGGNQAFGQQTGGTTTGLGGPGQTQQQGSGAPVGSAAVREQGMLRDREAQNFHAQSQELAEAERLEQKAREHRERAVAQGAHPHNKVLGGTAAVNAQATQPGSGQQRGY